MSFYSKTTEQVLKANAERFTKDRTNIPNSHPSVASEQSNWETIAKVFGVGLEETKYTLTVRKANDTIFINTPSIMAIDGQAFLLWGEIKKPLEELPKGTIEQNPDTKAMVLEVEHEDEYYHVRLNLAKGSDPELKDVRSAYKKGKLADMLFSIQPFQKPLSMSELMPGNYTVTEYRVNRFDNTRYEFYIQETGLWYKGNARVNRVLANQPVVTPQEPAKLEIGEIVETTDQGYPIVPAKLVTAEEAALPVYDFSFDD